MPDEPNTPDSAFDEHARMLIEAFANKRYNFVLGGLDAFADFAEQDPIASLVALVNALGFYADAHLEEDPVYR